MAKKQMYNVSYMTPEREGQPGFWQNIGKAWLEKSGNISLILGAQPMPDWNGHMMLFPVEAKKDITDTIVTR